MRGIHDGNMTRHPIVHTHILHINKVEVSHTKQGGKPAVEANPHKDQLA